MDNFLQYSIKFDFDKGTRSPSEVFSKMSVLSDGFCSLDLICCEVIGYDLLAKQQLVGVEYASIRATILNILKSIDDKDIEDLNWKRIIGKILVKCKAKAVEFLENNHPATNNDLIEFQGEISEIINQSNIGRDLAFKPPKISKLARSLVLLNSASIETATDERILLIQDGRELKVLRNYVITEERRIEILTEEKHVFRDRATVLVKKPDYLGNSMWEVIYNKKKESMRIESRYRQVLLYFCLQQVNY